MGATPPELERFVHVEPELPATADVIALLVGTYEPRLAVIDAAAGAYALQGLDDSKRGDAELFAAVMIEPFRKNGVTTITLDHVVKNADNRGKYTIGSERKTGGVDVHLGFEVVAPLVRGGIGLVRIVTHKDRHGWLPRPRAAELELRSDPKTHAIRWTFKTAEPDEAEETFRPTELMERVSRHLELRAEPLTRNDVQRDVVGKAKYLRLALDQLIAEGYVKETPSARNSRLVEYVRPFRKDECVPSASPQDDSEYVLSASRHESHNGAVSPVRPEYVPAAPPALGACASPEASSPTGGRTGQDAPGIGESGYPDLLAEIHYSGQITTAEALELNDLHDHIAEARR